MATCHQALLLCYRHSLALKPAAKFVRNLPGASVTTCLLYRCALAQNQVAELSPAVVSPVAMSSNTALHILPRSKSHSARSVPLPIPATCRLGPASSGAVVSTYHAVPHRAGAQCEAAHDGLWCRLHWCRLHWCRLLCSTLCQSSWTFAHPAS